MAVTAITIMTSIATTNPTIRPLLLEDGVPAGSGVLVLSSVVGCVLSVRVVEGVGDGTRVEMGGGGVLVEGSTTVDDTGQPVFTAETTTL